MFQKYGLLNTSLLFVYMDEPSMGFYCIYRKRDNQTVGYIPDCASNFTIPSSPLLPATFLLHSSSLRFSSLLFSSLRSSILLSHYLICISSDITQTTTTHANWLNAASIDYVAFDASSRCLIIPFYVLLF
jgi:hypothetical protein